MLSVAGRNLFATEIESLVADPLLRPGECAAVPDGGGRYTVVAEPVSVQVEVAELRRLARELRSLLVRGVAVGPARVVYLRPGTLPKTPSGKVQRHRVGAGLVSGSLDVLAVVELDGRG
jgi:fatty-acyl-CoA synthase